MSIISIIFFMIFIILVLTLFRKGTDIFSPARLFLIVWTFAIGLTNLKWSAFQRNWTIYSWIMLLIALLSTLTGMFVIYVINIDKSVSPVKSGRAIIAASNVNTDILFLATTFLFAAYLISYLISYLVVGFLPLFTRFPGLSRIDWGIFGFGLFIQAFPSIIYLSVLYLVLEKKHFLRKFIVLIIILVSFVTYSFLLQRYYIAFAIVVSVVALYYSSKVFRPRNVIITFLALVAIMYSMTFVRFSSAIVNYLYYLSRMKIDIKYSFITEPYMYVVMNLENFAHAAEKLQGFTYGTYTFDFIWALSGVKHPLAEYLHLTDYPNLISSNFNTYTMFFVYYRDYGVIGLGVIPFIIGVVFSMNYYKMKKSPNINTISIYAIFSFVILFSFFVPLITFLHFAFNLFIIYLVTKIILKQGGKYNYEPKYT